MRNGMCRHTNGDRRQPRRDDVRNLGASREHQRQRPRPELRGESHSRFGPLRYHVMNDANVGNVHDHRVVRRSSFRAVDLLDGLARPSICTEPVDGFRWERDESPGAKNPRRFLDRGEGGMVGVDANDTHCRESRGEGRTVIVRARSALEVGSRRMTMAGVASAI